MKNKIIKVEDRESFEENISEIEEEIMEDREIEAITNKRFNNFRERLEIAKECFR